MVWTADANHFTVDDNANHTADGWHVDDVWTADADHFTVDDNTNHTADGWHTDATVVVVGNAGGGIVGHGLPKGTVSHETVQRYWRQRHLEDEAILQVIGAFLDKAA